MVLLHMRRVQVPWWSSCSCRFSRRLVQPICTKQRDLQRSIVKLPNLLNPCIVGILLTISVIGIYTDATILVGALVILGFCVKSVPIYVVSLEYQNCRRWLVSQRFQLSTICIRLQDVFT